MVAMGKGFEWLPLPLLGSHTKPINIRQSSGKLPVRQMPTARPGKPPASGGSFSEVMGPRGGSYQQ